jgi:hypothetical protein
MSLTADVEIESTDTVVKRCTQALIDCGATGCFNDIEWVKLNNISTHPLTKLIPVYNVNGTVNNASMITDIANIILHYENHSEHMQLAITHFGKQSLILGYNWLCNHNPEMNWQTRVSRCLTAHYNVQLAVEDKCETKIWKSMTSRINACRSGVFPMMVEEDEDESPHVNINKTDEEVQDMCLVRRHPSISLLPLSSPTLPLFICTLSPHLCIISRDYTQRPMTFALTVRQLCRSRLPDVVDFPTPYPLVP